MARDEFVAELGRLTEDVEWTEKAHFAASSHMMVVHYGLGATATVSAAVAGATVVAAVPIVAGIAAAVATVASALLTFLKPEARAQHHLGSARGLGRLKVQLRQTRELDLAKGRPEDFDTWRAQVDRLANYKSEIDASAPALGEWAFRTARKKIEAGNFFHDGLDDPPPVSKA